MRWNILLGGQAGGGINKVSEIIANIFINQGYFVFNYRDYGSLIRGGHNFNILSFSDKRVGSYESQLDGLVALDDKTIQLHKNKLKKGGFIINYEKFEDAGRNLNVALAGALAKVLGIEKQIFLDEIKREFGTKESLDAGEKGFESCEKKFSVKRSNNKIFLMTGSEAVAKGALNSRIDLYLGYPMTPATGVMHEFAAAQIKNKEIMVFQPENEIAVVNVGLGASFAGSNVMVGTSGGGFDLMSEGLSMQGISEIPLTVYLAARAGPATGVPTYTSQADLNVALRAGHGEFPRVLIAPGDPKEAIEKTNEAIYLANKFNSLSIILSDKHLAESQFSFASKLDNSLKIPMNRKIPSKGLVKASSYEHDKSGNTIEDAKTTIEGQERRLKKYEDIKRECEKFQMFKIYGKKNSKNLVVSWGSNKGAILDAIEDLDCKFLHIIYLKPLSKKIRSELEKAKKIVLIECNSTGQLGRVIREGTGIKIEKRILKYDARPFVSDGLREEIRRRLR